MPPNSLNPHQLNQAAPYQDFHIRFTRLENGRFALHINSPAGQTQTTVQQPFPQDEATASFIEWLRELIARPDDAETLGRTLREFLFPPPVQTLFDRSLAVCQKMGQGLRVRLWLQTDQPELSLIPWEYCAGGFTFLALAPDTPLVRSLTTNRQFTPRPQIQPLRVLVATANPTGDLQTETELAHIRTALRLLRQEGTLLLYEEENATSSSLREAIQTFRPHVLHVMGHGTLTAEQEGAILLMGENGRFVPFTAQDLMVVLQGSTVRLAVLNACHTASHPTETPLFGMAQQLALVGLPAVIGMQFRVPDTTAKTFSQVLYRRLAEGHPVETAVTYARQELFVSGEDKTFWAIPVLFLQGDDGFLWQTTPDEEEPELWREPRRLQSLIGQEAVKEHLLATYQQVRGSGQGRTVVLMGAHGTGRLALARLLQQVATENGDAVETADLLAVDPREYAQFVRGVARKRPFVLLIDRLEREPSVWLEFLYKIADEIASQREKLPVLLLFTLTAAHSLAELKGKQHTEFTRFVQKLHRDGLADVYSLDAHLTLADIQTFIDPAAPALGQRLYDLVGGVERPMVEIIWREWVAAKAVLPNAARVWQAAAGAESLLVYGDVADEAERQLAELLHSGSGLPPYSQTEAETILRCAATEGELFTAQAVAGVLGLEADEVIDFFDEFLSPYHDPDDPDNSLTGMVEEAGFVQVDKFRTVLEYRFTRPYLYSVWRHYPRLAQERQQWSIRLGQHLERLYYGATDRIADRLIALFQAGAAPDLAYPYEQHQDKRVSLELLWLQVQTLLADPHQTKYDLYRLFDLGFRFLHRLAEEQPQRWAEGVVVAQALHQKAIAWPDEEFEVMALHHHAWHLRNSGQYQQGILVARQALQLCEQYGLGDTLLALILNNLGTLLHAQGELAAAKPHLERALAIREKQLGADHPDTAMSLHNMGTLLQVQGELAASKLYLEHALAIYEKQLGADHPSTARSLNNLGMLWHAQGQLIAAKPYLERALAIYEKQLGADHPNTATSLNNLGSLLKAQGELAAAKPYLERALAIWEKQLGADHPDTATCLNNLGNLLQAQGELAAAKPYLERALAIKEKQLGADHPRNRISRNNLAILKEEMGE